ncbi:LLM class F420-dependent oxidoreductase [Kitasatospora xanthocidica]|uniref:LLM class flavin-dependent oxidoreductase n=1 Tax=Kitasatospora xanthocidica TaxID=83382 RepID=UPI00198DC082|nr:LLM class flavin-dependent oxidoreductase [Kitasatospora xanthocidica]GHF64486.1 LLM class F420-dependent oxidoreductase [Kitasatospora xanthocidica]
MSTSVFYPVMVTDMGSVTSYARLAESASGRRLWLGQSLSIETHHVFAALSATGLDLSYGSAVTVMPLCHPLTAAVNARSVAMLSGQPYVAGIGPGAAALQRSMLGAPYPRPIATTRRYATVVRTLLEGGRFAAPDGPWATEGLELPDVEAPPVQLGLGVLREPMARLAGEVADWAITWLTPPAYLRERIVPAITEAAAAAQRPKPRLAAVVQCAVARPRRDLAVTAFHAVGNHLAAPHYTDMLNQAGVPADPADPRTGAELLVEHGVMATGTPEEIADRLDDYRAAGVDEVIVNVGGVHITEGVGAAVRDLSAILAAVGRRAR